MATRARIGIMQKSGRIIASYQHWDGYPGGLGYNLCENWENSKKVTDAIKLGDRIKWGVITGREITTSTRIRHGSDDDFRTVIMAETEARRIAGYKVYKDEAEYIKNGFRSGEQYVYLMKDTGDKDYLGKPKFTWYYVESRYTDAGKEVIDTEFKPLERYAILEHIDILKRVLEQTG